MNKLLVLLLVLMSLSCSDSPLVSSTSTKSHFIDDELRPFVESFIVEANKRGVYLDIQSLDALIVNEFSLGLTDDYCAYGWYAYNGTDKMRVEILNDDDCWHNRTLIEKENLMYHELGHAFLSRPHYTENFPNGSPRSIMCTIEGRNACYNYQVYHENPTFRNYFLDELFNFNTSDPAFIDRQNFKKIVFEEGAGEFVTDWALYPELVEGDTLNFTFTDDSITHRLSLATDGSSSEESVGWIVKQFDLLDFEACTNLKAFMDINVSGITEGYMVVALSLSERLEDGTLRRIYLNLKEETTDVEIDDYLHEMYCLPEKAEVATISYWLKSKTPAIIEIENLHVDLYE